MALVLLKTGSDQNVFYSHITNNCCVSKAKSGILLSIKLNGISVFHLFIMFVIIANILLLLVLLSEVQWL